MESHCIKFPCNLIQYQKLPLVELKRKYGIVVNYYNKSCIIGGLDSHYGNVDKEVSYAQAVGIIQHIKEYGLR